MLTNLKKALVESYVGAIGIGMLISQAVVHFASIFSAPIAQWISVRQYRELTLRTDTPVQFSLAAAIPDLIRCAVILSVSCLLLKWLYFSPVISQPTNTERSL